MSFKQLVVVRILLMIAKFVAPSEWQRDIDQLASHFTVHGPKDLEADSVKDKLIVDLQRKIEAQAKELTDMAPTNWRAEVQHP